MERVRVRRHSVWLQKIRNTYIQTSSILLITHLCWCYLGNLWHCVAKEAVRGRLRGQQSSAAACFLQQQWQETLNNQINPIHTGTGIDPAQPGTRLKHSPADLELSPWEHSLSVFIYLSLVLPLWFPLIKWPQLLLLLLLLRRCTVSHCWLNLDATSSTPPSLSLSSFNHHAFPPSASLSLYLHRTVPPYASRFLCIEPLSASSSFSSFNGRWFISQKKREKWTFAPAGDP